MAERLTRLSHYLGLQNPSFEGFVEWVMMLRREVGIPNTLAELGVKQDAVEALAEKAAADPTAGSNPVPLNKDNLRGLIQRALSGRLS